MKLEEDEPKTLRERVRRKQIYTLMIVGFVGAIAAGLLLASSVWQWKWDTPGSPKPQATSTEIDPSKGCSLQSTLDAIKTELFRRAAQARGRDAAAYMRIAGFSLFRVDSPTVVGADQQQRRIDCSGTADLQLPPQIALVTGGNMLAQPIDYSVQLDASGNATSVSLGNADAIVAPLSTIASLAPPAMLTAPAPASESASVLSNQATSPEPPPLAIQNESSPPAQPQEPQNEQ